jgi:hypothetical protein
VKPSRNGEDGLSIEERVEWKKRESRGVEGRASSREFVVFTDLVGEGAGRPVGVHSLTISPFVRRPSCQ